MTKNKRQQLTLFVDKSDAGEIEAIRKRFNPRQSELIDCHVTLCREDEIVDIDKVLNNLKNCDTKEIAIQFGQPTMFDNGKGVLLPATGDNEEFHQLRERVLKGLGTTFKRHEPHITLMHPRNSTCTDKIFDTIQEANLQTRLKFNAISLIEQGDGGEWQIIKTINLKLT